MEEKIFHKSTNNAMSDIKVNPDYNLLDFRIYEEIEKFIKEELLFDEPVKISHFAHNLNNLLLQQNISSGQHQELINKYQTLLTQLYLASLPHLSEDELLNLLQNHLIQILDDKVNINDMLRIYIMMHFLVLEERDIFKHKIIDILENNNELIGGTCDIGDGKQLDGVGRWLAYRRFRLGVEDKINIVKQSEFLVQDKAIINLSIKSRERLNKLYRLYWQLHKSSLTQEGWEDPVVVLDNGRLKFLSDGILTDINTKVWNIVNNVISEEITAKDKEQESIKPINLQSTPQVMKKPEPAFFFDINDEKEADRYREPITKSQWPRADNLEKNLRQLAEEVIKNNNFRFKDETSHKRFVNLFVSYMKDVRDVMEVKEMLTKEIATGGLGLQPDKANIVLDILKKVHNELPKKMEEWSKLATSSLPPVSSQSPNEELVTRNELPEQLPPGVIAPPAPLKEGNEEIKPEPWQQIPNLPPIPETPIQTTKKLEDVKAPPKILGPIEELRLLNLVDFRRLGTGASDIANKIVAKIQLIGETGIGRKYQAIRAWQASPVYRMYVDIGIQSIEQQKKVSDIILAKQQVGEETLTVAEFEAIVDLNKKLRF